MASAPPNLLRVRVSIIGTEPMIWRQLEVDTSLRFDELHDVLQLAFGWRNSHLHQFTDTDPWQRRLDIGPARRVWGTDAPFIDADDDDLPERDWTLAQVFDGFDGPLYYEYDFGDGWIHQIELIERIHDTDAPRALLLRADQRGPLEDSGGIGGYAEKLEILADPSHPEHQHITEWVEWVNGPWTEFDPEAVDVEGVNAALAARFGTSASVHAAEAEGADAAGTSVHAVDAAAPDAAAPDAVPPGSAIAALLERMPAQAAVELRAFLRRTGALQPSIIEVDVARSAVEPFAWLIRRAGADGIRLTQAGWLPPAVVSDAMHELGWTETWIGKANREDQTYPILELREDATRFGLLRKRNGVLHATAAAKKLADDPVGLWRHVAASVVRKARPQHAERDIAVLVAVDVASGRYDMSPSRTGYDLNGVIFGLEVLGWSGANGYALTEDDVSPSVYDVLDTLQSAGAFGPRRRYALLGSMDAVIASGRAFAREMLLAEVE